MTQWRFPATSAALHATDNSRSGGWITLQSGESLRGPYIEVPAGQLIVRIRLVGSNTGDATMDVSADRGQRIIATRDVTLDEIGDTITLAVSTEEMLSGCEVRLHCGPMAQAQVAGIEIDLDAETPWPDAARPVGYESSKTYAAKLADGFVAKYLSGASVLEVGYVGYFGGSVPIVPQAVGVDVGYPGYADGVLPFADASFDTIYSSHCFEHIADYVGTLREWYRLLKAGGFMIIVVPHQHLFEKRRRMPSRGNHDHKRFYTSESLLGELGEALEENRWRVRHLRENDEGFNYDGRPNGPSHGLYEIELVVEKIAGPVWNLDDQTARPYAAGEFDTQLHRPDPWTIELDASSPNGPVVRGPWIALTRARYRVDFHFRPIGWAADALASHIECAVAVKGLEVARAILTPEILAGTVLTLHFAHDEPAEAVDFSVHRSGPPLPGALRFRGIVVDYAEA